MLVAREAENAHPKSIGYFRRAAADAAEVFLFLRKKRAN